MFAFALLYAPCSSNAQTLVASATTSTATAFINVADGGTPSGVIGNGNSLTDVGVTLSAAGAGANVIGSGGVGDIGLVAGGAVQPASITSSSSLTGQLTALGSGGFAVVSDAVNVGGVNVMGTSGAAATNAGTGTYTLPIGPAPPGFVWVLEGTLTINATGTSAVLAGGTVAGPGGGVTISPGSGVFGTVTDVLNGTTTSYSIGGGEGLSTTWSVVVTPGTPVTLSADTFTTVIPFTAAPSNVALGGSTTASVALGNTTLVSVGSLPPLTPVTATNSTAPPPTPPTPPTAAGAGAGGTGAGTQEDPNSEVDESYYDGGYYGDDYQEDSYSDEDYEEDYYGGGDYSEEDNYEDTYYEEDYYSGSDSYQEDSYDDSYYEEDYYDGY